MLHSKVCWHFHSSDRLGSTGWIGYSTVMYYGVTQQGMPTLPFNWHAWEYRLDQIQHCYDSENSFKLYLKLLSTSQPSSSQPSSSRWRPLVVQQVLNSLSLISSWLSGCDCVLQFSENINKKTHTHTKMVICTRLYSLIFFVLFCFLNLGRDMELYLVSNWQSVYPSLC